MGHWPLAEKFWRVLGFSGSQDDLPAPEPWLDRPDWEKQIDLKVATGSLTSDDGALCRKFSQEGYLVARGLISESRIDRAWQAYEEFYSRRRTDFHPSNIGGDPWPERYLNTHLEVPEIAEILTDRGLLDLAGRLLGKPVRAFQTITSHKGTEQGAHSDAIHMTTRPPGYLLAAWVAFEDIHPDSGPLFYYPGSHRLPLVLSRHVAITPEEFGQRRYDVYHERYEPRIGELIEENGLQKRLFLGGKGDVLLWHSNLLHGGAERKDLARSRKAVVCHYFAEGVECYHDLSGKPAVFSEGAGVAVAPVSRRGS